MNTFKTFLLMLGLTLLLIGIGYTIAGRYGMIYALIFVGIMNFASYWFSDKIVLALYRAKEIKEAEMPKIYSIVRRLSQSANIPMPRIFIMNIPTANAFATGRDPEHAAVAVTKGILDLLNDDELEAVIAHELSHVKNRDVLIASVAATIAGAIFMLARMAQWAAIFGGYGGRGSSRNRGGGIGMLVVAIIAPITAMIIQMAISRSREYQADATGSKISGKPLSLASALKKLSEGVKQNPAKTTNPTTAHLFIVNPFSAKSLFRFFSTHPPVEERVKRLEKINSDMKNYNIPKVIY